MERKMRERMVREILKNTHRDYKNTRARAVMPPVSVFNGTTLVRLDDVSDEELCKIHNKVVR